MSRVGISAGSILYHQVQRLETDLKIANQKVEELTAALEAVLGNVIECSDQLHHADIDTADGKLLATDVGRAKVLLRRLRNGDVRVR